MDQIIEKNHDLRTTAQNDIIITLSDSDSGDLSPFQPKSKRKRIETHARMLPVKKEPNVLVDLSSTTLIKDCEESSNKYFAITSEHDAIDDTSVLSDSPPPPDFISLSSEEEKGSTENGNYDSDTTIEDEVPGPIANEPKWLRPIVIDGSNVARGHGKVMNMFSWRGIQIAVDYFMGKGHTQVTAFVPQFRQHILPNEERFRQELAKRHVVFTPVRRSDETFINWNDWFLVEYATKTGGIILSNNNYRDFASRNEEFRKTINERLLQFCFVGDLIMVPRDPLGKDGPSLENFLSFPD